MSAPSVSATSSRASQADTKRSTATQEAVFQVLDAISHPYPRAVEWASILVDVVQPLAFALHPHVWGHDVTWNIIYFAHLPFWDGTYNDKIGFTGFLVLFWITSALVLVCALTLLYGVVDPHFASTKLVRGLGLRHLINVVTGALVVPTIHMCFALFCESKQTPGRLWLFPSETTTSTVVEAHFGAAIAVATIAASLAYLVANASFTADFWAMRRQSYSYLDRLVVLFRLTMVASFHLLLSRNHVSAYTVCVGIASALLCAAYCFALPYCTRWINTIMAVTYATVAWCSVVNLIVAKEDSEWFTLSGNYYVLLGCGWVLVAAAAAALSRLRYCGATDRLLAASLTPEFVSREENPFAIAALRGDADLLPFPKHLPLSDYAFSPHRFVEGDIVDELLRRETSMEHASLHDAVFGDERDLSIQGIEKYIDRVQVVSPTVTAVYLPTDAELACRFLDDWSFLLAADPTPHMLSFACRIYCKAMMKFSDAPIVAIHFVKFLTLYAPSLSRMNLAMSILDDLPRKVYCNTTDAFHLYRTGRFVRQMLGLRDKAHNVIFNSAKMLHKNALVQTAALWKMLESQGADIVSLATLANSLTEQTSLGLSMYVQALRVAHDDEMLLRSFGSYLSTLLHNRSIADDCREEAEAVSQKRRNNLLNAAANNTSTSAKRSSVDGGGASEGESGAQQRPAGGMGSRVGSAASSSRVSGDTTSAAIQSIVDSVGEYMDTFRQNLHSSGFFVSVVIVFVLLFALIAAQAALMLSISVERESRVEQLQALGRELSVSQQAVYIVRRLAEDVAQGTLAAAGGGATATTSAAGTVDRIAELVAITAELEALHSSLMHGVNALTGGSTVRFLEAPSVFITQVLSNATVPTAADRTAVGFWDVMYLFIGSLHQVIEAARASPPGDDLLANKHVRFVLENGPRAVSDAGLDAVSLIHDADKTSSNSVIVSMVVTLGVTLLVVASVTFVFLWNFRRMATLHVQALRLFRLVPRDTVKRLSAEAKDNVERFMSGEIETKEGAFDAGLPDAAVTSSSSVLSDSNSISGDLRKESVSINPNLLQHLLRRSSQVIMKDHNHGGGAAAVGGPSATGAGGAAGHDNPQIVELLGSNVNVDDSMISKASSSSSHAPSAAADKRVSFSVLGEGGYKPGASSSAPGGKRRPSISVNAALHSSKRRSLSEFGEKVDSASDDDDDEHEGVTIRSFQMLDSLDEVVKTGPVAAKTSFEWTPRLLLSLLMTLVFVGVGAGLAFQYTQVISTHNGQRTWMLQRAKTFATFSEDKNRHATNAIIFGLSQHYERYPTVVSNAVADSERELQDSFDLSLFDFQPVFAGIDQLSERLRIGAALAASSAGFPLGAIALLATIEWQAPRPDAVFRQRYEDFAYNESAQLAFTTATADRARPIAEQARIARTALLDQFIEADAIISAAQGDVLSERIIRTAAATVTTQKSEGLSYLVPVIVAFVLVIPSAVVFAVVCPVTAPRRITLLVLLAACACLTVSAVAIAEVGKQHTDAAVMRAVNIDATARYLHLFVRYSTAYVTLGNVHDLHEYARLLTSSEEDRRTSTVLGGFRDAAAQDDVDRFYLALADLRKMIKVVMHLAAVARGHIDLYPEIFAADYSLQSDPNYRSLLLRFPEEIGAMYTNKSADSRLPPERLLQFGEALFASHRFSTALDRVEAELSAVDTRIKDELTEEIDAANAQATTVAIALAVVSGVLLGMVVLLVAALAIASIETLTSTRAEEEVYETSFATLTRRSVSTMTVVALLFVVVCACGVAFTVEITNTQALASESPKRTWAVAAAMAAAEEAVSADTSRAIAAQQRLQKIVTESIVVEREAYFGSAVAIAMRRRQNERIFGPTGPYAVQDVRVTGLSSGDRCFDYANAENGNLATVETQYLQFFDIMRRIAYFRIEDLIAERSTRAAGAPLPAVTAVGLLASARQHVDTTMKLLSESDLAYAEAAHDFHRSRRVVMIIVLIVTFAAIVIAYVAMIRPIVALLEQQEVGIKLLLNILPHETRTSIAEINDFFEGDSRGKDDQLKKKLQQSEKLLQNILPPLISRRLKNGEVCIADTHPDVTVVFAALIGFDEYSGRMMAQEIVIFLNDLIVTFDHVVDLLELEKIKTIGDVYFLCGGLTPKTKENHAMLCMEGALIFQDALRDHNDRHQTPNLMLRIGINSDPAVAGVIGSTKVAYDLWGDSVNTASRMQSTGIPGKVQVSHNTFRAKNIQEFYTFSERKIEAKGKGSMTTHIFESRAKPSPYQNLKWRMNR